MIPHPFGVAGLLLNSAAAVGLLKFTSNPDANAGLPHDTLRSLRTTMPELRRPYQRAVLGWRLSLVALALGFLLQLLDLLSG